ncbi:MAG: O-antigen ligase family protein [Candidatus Rokubacteria bacterium]|nr:O-antigen ligase family protein [Candidatus Rokubacteria bacterium]
MTIPAARRAQALVVIGALTVAAAFLVSETLTRFTLLQVAGGVAAVALFALVFVSTDFGLYVLILSMLLSPEFSLGGALAERREVVIRIEDFVLLIIAFAWLAKTAINKELALVGRSPLNLPIAAYVGANLLSTLLGMMLGSVKTVTGLMYVVKYVEYFFVYYMVANNLRSREHAWRLVSAAFGTAIIVALYGLAQIPSGERVSAPFEGQVGEPNTFGGYMLLMIAIVLALALETRSTRVRAWSLGMLVLFVPPFLFTLSRASFLGAIPMLLVLVAFSRHRAPIALALAFMALLVVVQPAFVPRSVHSRIHRTFEPETSWKGTVAVGQIQFDPSTSERLISFRLAFDGWMERPIFGYGVTGFRFMDAQYAKLLVEAGLVGLVAFAWLIGRLLRELLRIYRRLTDPDDRGLALGLLAGLVGLLVHGVGSNTFIIIRIMEPFWFFVAVAMMLSELPDGRRGARPAGAMTTRRTAAAHGALP